MRKAIDGKLREESKDYPGYFKYEFIIQEEDGSKTKIPAYGVDMQDALARIVKIEKIKKIKKRFGRIPDWVYQISWFSYLIGIMIPYYFFGNVFYTIFGLILPFVFILGLKTWGDRGKLKKR